MSHNTSGTKEVLRVRNLSKVYRIYDNPIDRLKEFFVKGKRHTDFVALGDVSFSVKESETLGIIGDNGAGKSTLLRLIAGALSPTSGEIELDGNVLALLELGVGFHPEFTGRENIFFYGEMLGYPRSFINSKYDEIVEFSELGAFIDRALLTYSTGMQMRLAFSLVSSLEPDILIVDEALSVGDLHFQKKCIDRITNFKKSGKTIIFCSHSTYHISILCDKVMWLKDGKIEMYGETTKVIPAYDFYQTEKDNVAQNDSDLKAKVPVIIKEVQLLNRLPVQRGDDLKVSILLESKSESIRYHVNFSLKIDSHWGVYFTGTNYMGIEPLQGKRKKILITFPKIPILGGFYYIVIRVFDDNGFVLFHEKVLPPFEVVKDSSDRGVCYLENHWEIQND